MTTSAIDAELTGLGFPEALRWRDGALWFSDMFRARVMRWVPGQPADVVLDSAGGGPSMPGGLGWLPDGSLLAVDCTERRVLVVRDGVVATYTTLSSLTDHALNDMHVDEDGTAWVGGYGFDPDTDEPRPSALFRITPDGAVTNTSPTFVFPNGADRRLGDLIVAETFADRLSTVDVDGRSTRQWALPRGSGPDGISAGRAGDIWVALAFSGTLAHIGTAGSLSVRYRPSAPPGHPGSGILSVYDCALAPDENVIAVACADRDEARALDNDTGLIRLLRVADLPSG